MGKMREEFESWAVINGLRLDRQKSMCGSDMGRYDFGPTQAALEVWCDAWKSCRAELCIELPDSDDEYQDEYVRRLELSLNKAGVSYK